ncbi:MAG: hypothetical protein IJX85_09520 [Lachnospiraceae bacterium]|nr:hypothetical protein [Lachnospiraceae bacterium]
MNAIEKGELKKNLKYVVTTGMVTVLVTNIVGLIMPLCLTYEAYAEYKIYTTYIAFAGLLHFGFINGVYLEYGKLNYDQLPKDKFRAYFLILLIMQMLVTVGMVVFALFCFKEYKLSYFYVALNVPLINLNCYFSLINQFTKRFKKDTTVQGAQSLLWCILAIGLFFGVTDDSREVLPQVLFINLFAMIYQIAINCDIAFGKREKIKNVWCDVKGFIKSGSYVMLSELIGLILINVDLIFVQHLFSVYDFAIYAFAVSIINAVYALMTYVNGICYPYLVRENDEGKTFEKLHNIMLDLGILFLATYYVLEVILREFVPQYTDSIPVIKILYVTILVKMIVMGVYNNVCKVLKKNNVFLVINIFVLIVSVVLNWVAFVGGESVEAIGIASVVSSLIWLAALEIFVHLKVPYVFVWIRIFIAVIAFLCLNYNFVLSVCLYLFVNVVCKFVLGRLDSKIGSKT